MIGHVIQALSAMFLSPGVYEAISKMSSTVQQFSLGYLRILEWFQLEETLKTI